MATCQQQALVLATSVTSIASCGSKRTASAVTAGANSVSRSEFFAGSRLFAVIPAAAAPASSVVSPALAPVCKVNKGDAIPGASLKDQDGKVVSLTNFKGKPLVLYFYPADETPGCTKQACAFRDSYEKFKKAGAEVIGVSSDNPASHRAFKQKYKLPFTLLSDEGNKLRKDWGVPGDLFGTLPGRQTYVFDKNGYVKLIFNNQFQPEKHVDETLKVLKNI